ncbi:hypothetical protein BDN67DRAFT_973694 [Paxillus ammoniavirescens]|nr:hypothetical protein BDN67DRAFT_973694 [Paxillus ammoniavirescens]
MVHKISAKPAHTTITQLLRRLECIDKEPYHTSFLQNHNTDISTSDEYILYTYVLLSLPASYPNALSAILDVNLNKCQSTRHPRIDVPLLLGWSMPFLSSLVYTGAYFAGQRDWSTVP